MKRIFKFFSFNLLVILGTTSLIFNACRPVTGISLDTPTLTLAVGEDYTFTATVLPENATDKTVIWSSSANDIAVVSDGILTALSQGTAVITAQAGNQTSVCIVTVFNTTIDVTAISLDKPSLTLVIGKDYTLTATVLPEDATDPTVAWTSSDNAIAAVADGNVTALSKGTAAIIARAGDQTAACVVTVTDLPVSGVVINGVKWAICNVGKPGTFTARPEDAGMFYQWNRKVAWPATGDKVTGWVSSYPAGDTWAKSNDPSPAGWRVPTREELRKLLDVNKVSHEWTTVNGIKGKKFIDKTTGNSIFLPAAGYRNYNDGLLTLAGWNGYYWSNMKYGSDRAYALFAPGITVENTHVFDYLSSHGFNMRPVAD